MKNGGKVFNFPSKKGFFKIKSDWHMTLLICLQNSLDVLSLPTIKFMPYEKLNSLKMNDCQSVQNMLFGKKYCICRESMKNNKSYFYEGAVVVVQV